MKKFFNTKQIDQLGFSQNLIIALFVVAIVALIGAYILTKSHAQELSKSQQASFNYSNQGCPTLGKVIVSSGVSGQTKQYTESYYQSVQTGSTGACVVAAKSLINQVCSTQLSLTNQFDIQASNVVKKVQSNYGRIRGGTKITDHEISITGQIDPQTWGLLAFLSSQSSSLRQQLDC